MKRLDGQRRRRRIEQLAKRDGLECWYCDRPLALDADGQRPTIDEWIPLGRGGLPLVGNQVLACYECNHDKGSMTGAEYMEKRAGHADGTYSAKLTKQIRRVARTMRLADRPKPPPLTMRLGDVWPEGELSEGLLRSDP